MPSVIGNPKPGTRLIPNDGVSEKERYHHKSTRGYDYKWLLKL